MCPKIFCSIWYLNWFASVHFKHPPIHGIVFMVCDVVIVAVCKHLFSYYNFCSSWLNLVKLLRQYNPCLKRKAMIGFYGRYYGMGMASTSVDTITLVLEEGSFLWFLDTTESDVFYTTAKNFWGRIMLWRSCCPCPRCLCTFDFCWITFVIM